MNILHPDTNKYKKNKSNFKRSKTFNDAVQSVFLIFGMKYLSHLNLDVKRKNSVK